MSHNSNIQNVYNALDGLDPDFEDTKLGYSAFEEILECFDKLERLASKNLELSEDMRNYLYGDDEDEDEEDDEEEDTDLE